jgi:hypothetical protein
MQKMKFNSVVILKLLIVFLYFSVSGICQSQLILDDFSTGSLDRISTNTISTIQRTQSGKSIIKCANEIMGNRLVQLQITDNPFGQNMSVSVNVNSKISIVNFDYGVHGRLYLTYGLNGKGDKQCNLNQNINKFSKIVIEFDGMDKPLNVGFTLYSNLTNHFSCTRQNVSGNKIEFLLSASSCSGGPNFSLADIDQFTFYFESTAPKYGNDFGIKKIYLE